MENDTLRELRTFGEITYDSSNELGQGNLDCTKVYKGQASGREVAVKRINCDSKDAELAVHEIKILRTCKHDNIITYYQTEIVESVHETYLLIALELSDCSLVDWVTSKGTCLTVPILKRDVLFQITKGLDYLHTRTDPIIHRDLKPSNILLMVDKDFVHVKISDFAISRRIPENRTSVTVRTSSGSEGWRAPEILKLMEKKDHSWKMTPATDIFSLGCLFYYVLSEGKHPFGEGIRRQTNILDGKRVFSEFEKNPKYAADVMLIDEMIYNQPEERLTASAALQHLMFWNKEKTLLFLVDVSNNVKKEKNSDSEKCVREIEKLAKVIFGKNIVSHYNPDGWISATCPVVQNYLKEWKYNGRHVMTLVRAIRNMRHHYADLSLDVQNAVGEVPDQLMEYWTARFPLLIPNMWAIFGNLKDLPDHGLRGYYAKN